ncbi:MAG: hypothetical protein MT490_00265 [Sphingomonas sp.]|uniref:Fur family transcriptional regulator n=1 Tax=Sphingomonas sp. TaxID=28214 RepID=UPI00227360F3|nr:hypothetical protein [Sphingomonas sp.]MCX8474203.1 hypothetical protein [Sphingomonas sp.]
MASPRRPPGELDRRILALIEREGRPLSGHMLAEMLRAEGRHVAVSLVFRSLRKLCDQGALHKLLSARGYVRAPSDHGVYLCCTGCGAVGVVVDERPFGAIGRGAGEKSFRVRRAFVEVAGLCAPCSRREHR